MNTKIDNTDEARQYLLTFMRERFIDKTFGEYILTRLAGDFAWNLASALAERAASTPASPALTDSEQAQAARIIDMAKQYGWQPGGDEGAFEAVTRIAYEIGRDDRGAASPAPVAAITDEVKELHRRLAAETLRADLGWQRYESANADRNDLRAALAAAPQAQAEPDDWTSEPPKKPGVYLHRHPSFKGERKVFVGWVSSVMPLMQGLHRPPYAMNMRVCAVDEVLHADRLTPQAWGGEWKEFVATPAAPVASSEREVRNFVLHEAIQECRALIAHVDKRRPDSGEWEAYNNGIEECIEAMDNMLRAPTANPEPSGDLGAAHDAEGG